MEIHTTIDMKYQNLFLCILFNEVKYSLFDIVYRDLLHTA